MKAKKYLALGIIFGIGTIFAIYINVAFTAGLWGLVAGYWISYFVGVNDRSSSEAKEKKEKE